MATLLDYKVDNDFLRQYGINVGDPALNNNEAAIIDEAYDELLDFIFYNNDELDHREQAICDWLVDTEIDDEQLYDRSPDKIKGFKRAQYLVIRNLLTSDLNPITEEVVACLSGRCSLIKRNGFQKN